MTESERIIGQISSQYFFNEFVYDNLVFQQENVGENEFTDVLIKFCNKALLIQIKERTCSSILVDVWLDKILKKANVQHKKSIDYIEQSPEVVFKNKKGNKVILSELKDCQIFYVSIFDNDEVADYKQLRESKVLGAYNIFSKRDFQIMCKLLISPFEILNYLSFRKKFYSGVKAKTYLKEIDDEIQIVTVENEEDLIDLYLWERYKERAIIDRYCESFRETFSKFKLHDSQYSHNYIELIENFMMFDRIQIALVSKMIHCQFLNKSKLPLNNFKWAILNNVGIAVTSGNIFDIKIAKHIIKSFKYCKKLDKAVLIYIVKKNDYPEIAFLYLNFPYYYNAEEEKCKSNFSELLEETQIVKNGSI